MRGTLLPIPSPVRYNNTVRSCSLRWTRERRDLIVVDAKKAIGLGVAVLLLFFVITQPASSAGLVHSILGMLRDAAESLISFVSALFRG